MAGYIKLWRKLFESYVWQSSTPEQKVILISLMLFANHTEKKWIWKGGTYSCKPGQFITSLDKIKEKAGMGVTTQNVRTALLKFKKCEFLTNESTKTGRLITICNWDTYQNENTPANKQANSHLTKSQQRPNKELTPNKNVKNDKNKEINKEKFAYLENPHFYKTFMSFIDMRKGMNKKPTAHAIDLLLTKLHKYKVKEAIKMLEQSIERSYTGVFEIKEDEKEEQEERML